MNPSSCEQGFSSDGQWLITVLRADKLTVQIFDVKKQELHKQFSSEWQVFRNMTQEPLYRSRFFGGFAHDDSIILWRYVREEAGIPNSLPIVHLHRQQWSMEGELISDQDLGVWGFAGNRTPVSGPEAEQFWLLEDPGAEIYRHYRIDEGHAVSDGILTFPKDNAPQASYLSTMHRLLTVTGERTRQKAVLLENTGKIDSEAELPFLPNLLGPFAPDWLYVHHLVHSSDDRFVAIGRSRVAWVLIDTDRDWGSEVQVLDTQSLKVISTLRVGFGGIQSLAIDHRDGTIRLVGYWGGRWHDLSRYEQRQSDWRKSHGS